MVKFGFYNSVNGDRTYDAVALSSVFDGIINDGIFMSVGTAFVVEATDSMTVNVGEGRAWFNHTWTVNDAVMPLVVPESEAILNRIDAVVLEVNSTDSVRANSIKIIKGTPASVPSAPIMVDTSIIHQHPICYIYVGMGVVSISQADITNKVGSSECPYVTGILETMDIDALLLQWGAQWEAWVQSIQDETTEWTMEQRQVFLDWIGQQEADMIDWSNIFRSEFEIWFNNMKDQLSTDAAGNLQLQINDITNIDLLNINANMEFLDRQDIIGIEKTTIFNSDGSITENMTNGGIKHTIFNPNGTITEQLIKGSTVVTKTTTFNADGSITEVIS